MLAPTDKYLLTESLDGRRYKSRTGFATFTRTSQATSGRITGQEFPSNVRPNMASVVRVANRGHQPQLPRAPADRSAALIEFAMECWSGLGSGIPNAASTVLSKISHIAWHHLRQYGYSVQLEPNHVLAVRGPPDENHRSRRPFSATPAIISTSPAPTTVLSGGATVVGFFFLLRRSEYLAVDGKFSQFAIQRRDMIFKDRTGRLARTRHDVHTVTLRIRGSKNDQLRESTTRALYRSGSSWLCPVRAAWALVEESKDAKLPDNSPLCKLHDGSHASSSDVSKLLKQAASRLGLDSNKFGTHSLRSGGATALYTGGNHDTTVKRHGRWKSDCFQRYIHIDQASTARLAKTMLNDDRGNPELSSVQQGGTPSHGVRQQSNFPARR